MVDYKDVVDPEIVDIIEDLNKLPFLETDFSCAGFGALSPKAVREGKENWHFGSGGRCEGDAYISIKYKTRDEKFCQDFEKLFVEVISDHPDDNAVAYYITHGDGADLPQKWEKIRKFVRKYVKNV